MLFLCEHPKDRLNRLIMEFQDFENRAIHKKDFDRIVFDRKNKVYDKGFEIAKILILNYSPALSSGNENMLALLFDMNVLWEEYIFRILYKHKPAGMDVSFQNSDRFWEHKRIRPDIVLTTDEETFVIDTKWKIIEAANPSDDDLKQMFVYNLHWNARKTLLLYPKTFQTDTGFGVFHYADKGNKCKLGFIDITSENGIKNGREVAGEILEKINLQFDYAH